MIYIYLYNIILFFINSIFIKQYLHIYQLKDYNNARYLKYFSKKSIIYLISNAFLLIFQLFLNNLIFVLVSNIIFLILNIAHNSRLIKSNKTPLKFTGKIKRLYIISIFLLVFLIFFNFSYGISNILLFFSPIISNFLNFYDKLKNKKFTNLAIRKLKNSNAKIIAITGSNGKTSVKNILNKLLSSKYKTQATPKSFNTPLGTAKFINESLDSYTEFLILEYGARRPKDIEKLCSLFGADYGIVTTVAPQHLQTFKSIENVAKTKNELPMFLKEKLCVFNLDNDFTFEMYNKKIGEKIGISLNSKSEISATNIRIENCTTKFDLLTDNNSYSISTSLLGKHNVLNILLATALAIRLDIPIKNIVSAIEKLKPTPHRLELIKTNINILDDSYNCSLASATEAINVLLQFPMRHFIATPGIIEGGKDEYEINFKLGQMLSNMDCCIIIGEHNKKAISDGLKSQNFNDNNLIFSKTLDEAKDHFQKLNSNGTLLILNDLPDDYI